jgi:hypothetical protein
MGGAALLNDPGEVAQGFIDFARTREHGGYVRIQHDDAASRRMARREFVGLGAAEVVLRQDVVAIHLAYLASSAFVLHVSALRSLLMFRLPCNTRTTRSTSF